MGSDSYEKQLLDGKPCYPTTFPHTILRCEGQGSIHLRGHQKVEAVICRIFVVELVERNRGLKEIKELTVITL